MSNIDYLEWCLAYGILSTDQSAALFEKVNKRKSIKQNPAKSQSKSTTVSKPKLSKKKKKRSEDDDEDDDDDDVFDTGLGDAGVWEGQGASGI